MNNLTSKRRFLSPPWLMFYSAIFCVVLVPLLHAAVSRTGERADRLRELEQMTRSERLRVQHQFEKFEKLTPEEQDHYRQMHARLNGEELSLKSTLSDYQAFLTSLNPIERAEIERQTTKRERVRAVDRIRKEREYRQQQLELGLADLDERRTSFQQNLGRHGWDEVLTSNEMDALSDVLLSKLPKEIKQRLQIDQQQGAARYALTLTAVLKTWGERATGVERVVIPEEVLEEVLSALGNDKIQSNLRKIPEPERRVFALMMLSERSLMREYMKEVPGTAELQKFLETRETEVRKELMQKEPAWMYLDLIRMYRETNPTPLSQALSQFKDEFDDLRKSMWARRSRDDDRGPGGRGPGRGPRGRDFERRPPEGEESSDDDSPRNRFERFRERREQDSTSSPPTD
ncbi:MAG: hypothetical protein HUJ26_12445 [Planctomycetaceae bacterium]|nr:hypothetical protein [Planctomycetaceae bacterium]